jgi:hypothetical protein
VSYYSWLVGPFVVMGYFSKCLAATQLYNKVARDVMLLLYELIFSFGCANDDGALKSRSSTRDANVASNLREFKGTRQQV